MKKFYLILSLPIITSTIFSMEMPKSGKENGVYEYKELDTIKRRWRKTDAQNAALQETKQQLKNSEAIAAQMENVLLKEFNKNPLLFQERPDLWKDWKDMIDTMESSGGNADRIKCWLVATTLAHKKAKSMKAPLIKSIVQKTATITIPVDAASSLLLNKSVLQRISTLAAASPFLSSTLEVATGIAISTSLIRLARQQKPTSLGYLSMLPMIGSASLYACKWLENLNLINKNSATKFSNVIAGVEGSTRHKVTNYVASSLALIALAKWIWDLQDETRRNVATYQNIQTYKEKMLTPPLKHAKFIKKISAYAHNES